jgi:WD40 repeat protein
MVVCLLLMVGIFGLMLGVGQLIGFTGTTQTSGDKGPKIISSLARLTGTGKNTPPAESDKAPRSGSRVGDFPVKVVDLGRPALGGLQPLVIQEARLLSNEKVDVPCEREGKVVCLGTEIKTGEYVSPEKRLPPVDFGFLAIALREGEKVPPSVKTFTLPKFPRSKLFRKVDDEKDELEPDRVVFVRQKIYLRKLEIGERVQPGQLLAIINPQLAIEELASKAAKLDSAEADRRSSEKTAEESKRRVARMDSARAVAKNSVNDDDYFAGVLAYQRYTEEERSKRMLVGQAQAELKASLATVNLHEIRSGISGVVKVLYKQPGEGVKVTEPVLQLQNPQLLRAEGFTEVQDAMDLKRRLDRGRELYQKAQQDMTRATTPAQREAAKQLISEAEKLTEVVIEPSRPVPPSAVLSGHINEVTCVAISSPPTGAKPLIVSGGEDRMVRIWEQLPERFRWYERCVLDHQAVVKAVACTGPKAQRNLLLTGTVNGQGRLFDLSGVSDTKKVELVEVKLSSQHSQAINCAAFDPAGTICATGGEDRTIHIWDATSGEHILGIADAHKAGVTALQFLTDKRFLSVGRDKRLVVWELSSTNDSFEQIDEFDRRSNDVGVLNASQDGKQVLFDDAREIRLMSMANHAIEGTLQNPTTAPNFSTLALFAPDGKTILTNGAAPGRLQLWRTPAPGHHGAELRQFVWNNGIVTCGAFSPDGKYAVTGTKDNQVLVWEMPSQEEVSRPLTAHLTYVEEFVDTSLKRMTLRAEMKKPDYVIPGGTATIVIPHRVIPELPR